MFFGMTNSPVTFQTMINNIFQDLIAEGIIVVYLDDILIFTRMEEEYAKAIRQILQVLQENKLFLHPEKCEFCKERIEYLGLVISENEVSMDPVKVAVMGDQREFDLETRVTTNGNNKTLRCFTVVH